MHPANQRVLHAAAELGLGLEIESFPEGAGTAEEAAAAVGCEVAQIVKSLVFVVDDMPVLALVSGTNRLDTVKLSAAAGGGVVRRADADAVREATSFAIGGVPPFGFTSPLPVYVDRDLLDHDVVWAAAGTPMTVFASDPHALVAATSGIVALLAE